MKLFISNRNFSLQFRLILIVFVLVLLTIPFQAFSQKEAETFSARNAVYVEFGGNSGRYAVNYSRIIYQKEKLKLNMSAGFSIWHYKTNMRQINSTKWLPVIPVEFSAFWGKSNHHLEIGTGITSYLGTRIAIDLDTYELIEKVVFDAAIPLRIGYRYQKPGGGFFFRVAYTPYFTVPGGGREDWIFSPIFAGLSIGKSF